MAISITNIENSLQFGDSQKLRLVRILRSTVMVRVGGGWVALDEFLVKNDPCRGTYPFNNIFHSFILKDKFRYIYFIIRPFQKQKLSKNVIIEKTFIYAKK